MGPEARSEGARDRVVFLTSVVVFALACSVAGAALRPAVERLLGGKVPGDGERVTFLEHAALDVRQGRGAALAKPLRELASRARDPSARERILALWAEAAVQAGQLPDALVAEEQREALVADVTQRSAVRLQRIGLAAKLGHKDEAEKLAATLLQGGDSRLADEARLRLMAGAGHERASAKAGAVDAEAARRAGLAALRLRGDAEEAARLLAPLVQAGPRDVSLCEALADAYDQLGRPAEMAGVLGLMLESALAGDERERARLSLAQAAALGRAGSFDAALTSLERASGSPDVEARRAARRLRYELLRQAGKLSTEVRKLRDPGERAYVALEIEGDYAAAVRLYREASASRPDSIELAQGLQEAERRLALAERESLYEQVLAKEPGDTATQQKMLATLVAMGRSDDARRRVGEALKGRESSAEALAAAGLTLRQVGLGHDAAAYLERAQALEPDVGRKQQLLFTLGEIYAEAQRPEAAYRVFTRLAGEGASAELRERAVARVVALLR